MNNRKFSLLLLALLIIAIANAYGIRFTGAATPADFAAANSSIASAFVAAQNADAKGGNVSSLVVTLNEAIALVQKAQTENSTDPSQALLDLQNATQLAGSVSARAPAIGHEGAVEKSQIMLESLGSTAVIIVIGLLIYLFGGRVYRRLWLYAYGDFIVRPA